MKRKRLILRWLIGILIASLFITGCSLLKGERGKLERKLGEFKKAEEKAFKVVEDGEKKDKTISEDELGKILNEMKKVADEFLKQAEQSDDKELKKDATTCHRGMKKTTQALNDYMAANERYLMFKDSVVQRFAEQAKKSKKEAFKKFKKGRSAGHKMIDKSGL